MDRRLVIPQPPSREVRAEPPNGPFLPPAGRVLDMSEWLRTCERLGWVTVHADPADVARREAERAESERLRGEAVRAAEAAASASQRADDDTPATVAPEPETRNRGRRGRR